MRENAIRQQNQIGHAEGKKEKGMKQLSSKGKLYGFRHLLFLSLTREQRGSESQACGKRESEIINITTSTGKEKKNASHGRLTPTYTRLIHSHGHEGTKARIIQRDRRST